jgi:hypothetical protein
LFCVAKSTTLSLYSLVILFAMAGIAQASLMTTTVSVFPDVLSKYGPLTTAFTYAPACTDRWIQYPQEGTDRITNSIPLECHPSIFRSNLQFRILHQWPPIAVDFRGQDLRIQGRRRETLARRLLQKVS